jgi:hypothetical protein
VKGFFAPNDTAMVKAGNLTLKHSFEDLWLLSTKHLINNEISNSGARTIYGQCQFLVDKA